MPAILLIDDDDAFRETLVVMLVDRGFTVVQASNGLEGVDAWRRRAPDLVITDMRMPYMDGLKTIRLLQIELPDIPVIACSGSLGGALSEAAALGAIALPKPFTPLALFEIIQRALEHTAS